MDKYNVMGTPINNSVIKIQYNGIWFSYLLEMETELVIYRRQASVLIIRIINDVGNTTVFTHSNQNVIQYHHNGS